MLTPGLLPWLAVAGGIGALLRHLLVRTFSRPAYPLGTAVVNLVGAAAGGALLGVSVSGGGAEAGGGSVLLSVLSVGLLGAFTTFSSWMTEIVGLREDGQPVWAILHLLGVLVAGLLLAVFGFLMAVGFQPA